VEPGDRQRQTPGARAEARQARYETKQLSEEGSTEPPEDDESEDDEVEEEIGTQQETTLIW